MMSGGGWLLLAVVASLESSGADGGSGLEVEALEPVGRPGASAARGALEGFESQGSVEDFEAVPSEREAKPLESEASVAGLADSMESFEAPRAEATVRPFAHLSGVGAVDTRFDSPRGAALAENVGEARLKASAGLDAKLSETVRVVVEARAQVRFSAQRELDRLKGFFEPMVGDAYVDVYSSWADVRVGNQRVPLGANALLAPADALNPRDLRESPVSGDPEDFMLPVFALRAQGELKQLAWLLAYVPFFAPHRFSVFGQDEGLLQPQAGQVLDARGVDPSIEDALQARLLETRRPMPFLGDLALRLVWPGRVKLGASWVWLNEKTPRVSMHPSLSALLASGGGADDATVAAAAAQLRSGQPLLEATSARSHLFSAEGSTLVGPGQLDLDVTYTPRATYVDPSFRPLDKASATWVIGYSQSVEAPVVYSFSYLGMAVFDVGAGEQLRFLETGEGVGSTRTVLFHLLAGSLAVPLWERRFEVSVRAAVEPVQGSYAVAPRVAFLGVERLTVWASVELYEGAVTGPFGYFGRNDKVMLGARFEL